MCGNLGDPAMFEAYELRTTPMTPGDVLGVFIEWHRQQARVDPDADPTAVFSLETTVAEWREACDLVEYWRLWPRPNESFRTDFDEHEWRADGGVSGRASVITARGVTREARARVPEPSLHSTPSTPGHSGVFGAPPRMLCLTGRKIRAGARRLALPRREGGCD